MPGNYFRCIGDRIALLLLLPAMGYAASDKVHYHPQQELYAATGLNQSKGRQTLKDILVSLETKYKVRINYVGQSIGSIQTEPPAVKGASVKFIQYLNQFLKPLGLEAEESGANMFIVYKQEGAAPAPKPAAPVEKKQRRNRKNQPLSIYPVS